jgi:hypothetical protein
MAASFLASFIVYIITGMYITWKSGLAFTIDPWVKAFVFLVMSINACFYFYIAAYTEMDNSMRSKLSTISRLEWGVRVVNECILFFLWFSLQMGWQYFGNCLILLYVTYLIWDMVTWRCFDSHRIFSLDVFGLVITIAFVCLGGALASYQGTLIPPAILFFWGGFSVLYIVCAILGIFVCNRFNPFAQRYRTRPELR